MTIPFGKYRGERVEDVPLSYLAWCVEKLDRVDPALLRAIRAARDWLRTALRQGIAA